MVKIEKVEYTSNPSETSALPYWKSINFNKPENMDIYSGKDNLNKDIKYKKIDKYFKMLHRLENIEDIKLTKDFSFRVFDVKDSSDYGSAVDIIKKSYENINMNEDILRSYMDLRVYNKSLWIFIVNNENLPVAFALADYDEEINEGILEWIQVLESYRGKGLGKALVKKLLLNLKELNAEFVTVSGDYNNKTNLINLYKARGFKEDILWNIAYK